MKLIRPLLLALVVLTGCQASVDPLGGQEGEPLTPPEAAPPPAQADPDFDGANDACMVTTSCSGPGWCADYSAETVPVGFEEDCEAVGGVVSDAPCAGADNDGFCTDSTLDSCTVVYLYEAELAEDPAAFCEAIGQEFVSPRG